MATYKIIGADGKEYGPVSAEQVRRWITEHRANGQTKARPEDATEWKTLAELAEFADAFAALPPAPAPTRPPELGTAEADAMAREILAHDYQVDIGRCFSRGWDLVMANFWLTVGATFVITAISVVASAVPFASLFLTYVLFGGLDWMFLELVRGQKAELGDAFVGFSIAFVPLLLFSLVGQLLTGVGFVLCILPGIYLMIAWMLFSALLIIDKKLDFWPAMELSRKVVSRHWWQVFGLFLLCLLVCLAGTLLCLVGVFIAMPITTAAIVYAYEDIFGSRATLPVLAPAPTTAAPAP